MHKNLAGMALVILAQLLSACGSSNGTDSDHAGSHQESYTYEYKEMSWSGGLICTTGRRTFDSKESYCLGLKSFDLNGPSFGRSCSLDQRKKSFERDCDGPFLEVRKS